MKKKKNKQVKRRLLVFGTLSIIGMVYFTTTFIKYTIEIKKLKTEETNLNLKLESLKHESENLKTEIEKLKNPEYIARYAREEYYYSKEKGEYVIKIEDDEEKIATVEENNNHSYKYYIIGIGAILLGIIIYIAKKG